MRDGPPAVLGSHSLVTRFVSKGISPADWGFLEPRSWGGGLSCEATQLGCEGADG